jgi:nitroimidazol reductase NimA-like FMN-containing flavoprotein (pyridoxamine 5'-phosphate oxidase superfamily)/GNAT superfamily N-acetyltransferase
MAQGFRARRYPATLACMRREIYRMSEDEALKLLTHAPVLHLAGTTSEGAPLLRALDGAVADGAIVFHGAPTGEKVSAMGRPAVVSAEEVVAHIPSWFTHVSDACAASTFYRSAQVHGMLERVDEPAAKVRAIAALMAKYQPEGFHSPVSEGDPALEGVLVFRVPLARVDGKAKLGQNRSSEDRLRILDGLWLRGEPGDPAAIEAIRTACPDTPVPDFLAAPPGATLHAALPARAAKEAKALLEEEYWWVGVPPDFIPPVHLGSQAWVGARDGDGRLVATARAVSDSGTAWIYDVVVARDWRGRGLGRRLVELVLDHPAVRVAKTVRLATRDARGLYERYGFVDVERWKRTFTETEMVLARR